MLKVVQKINALKTQLRNIPIEAMFVTVTERNKATIEDKNIAQLAAGIDSQGLPIEPPYTPTTVAIKKSLGQVFDKVTLHNEGPFWQGIGVNTMKTGFEMIGKDPKTPKLRVKYGWDIIGLTTNSKGELANEVYRPEILFELRIYFNLRHG